MSRFQRMTLQVRCVEPYWFAEPGPGQPGLHLPTLGLTVAAMVRPLLLQPRTWPALASVGRKPRTTGSLIPAWPQPTTYRLTLLGLGWK